MQIQATKTELASITDFQTGLHYPSIDSEGKSELLSSKFNRNSVKTTWYSTGYQQLASTEVNSDVHYKVNNVFHFLISTTLRTTLPSIKVKMEYRGKIRISWCHNVGTNIIELAQFKEDDLIYQTLDSIWLDDYFQYFMPSGAGKRRNHKIGVGSVPMLENWTDELPRYPINVDQPWFYGDDTSNAFPIFYKSSQAYHQYTFRRKITDLLRMQIYDDSSKTWQNTLSSEYMHCLIIKTEPSTPKDLISKPTLWGEYAYVTPTELNTYKCGKPKEIFIKDIEIIEDAENRTHYKHYAHQLLECQSPCLAMFWKAENIDAIKLNNYSNYTTNTDDLYSGWDPITKSTLKYATTDKFKDLESDHFNVGMRKHFPSA